MRRLTRCPTRSQRRFLSAEKSFDNSSAIAYSSVLMRKLFHREIFLPLNLRNLASTNLELNPTDHAREAAETDRYGAISIPAAIKFNGSNIVEAETVGGKLSKVVVRLSYDDTRDAIYAIGIDKGRTFLKTVWFNLKSDKHSTLRKEMYAVA